MAHNEYDPTLKKIRKERIRKVKKSRKLKQYIMGTIFLILLPFGWFYSLMGYFIPLCMLAGIGMASWKGRKWCDWMCPRGSFSDSYMKLISPERKIPSFFRTVSLRISVIIFLMSMLTYQIVRLWPDPYAIGKLFMTLLTITTGVSIVLAIIIHQRSWCYICPIGTISNWVGKNREPLYKKKDLCTNCQVCDNTCPMNLAPHELNENGKMSFMGDCLKCRLCIETCPKGIIDVYKMIYHQGE
jgi:ferredoxin-type protein NapH